MAPHLAHQIVAAPVVAKSARHPRSEGDLGGEVLKSAVGVKRGNVDRGAFYRLAGIGFGVVLPP